VAVVRSVMKRGLSALSWVLGWYRSPTGVVLLAAGIAGVALSASFDSWWPLASLAGAVVGVVVPYKLARSHAAIRAAELGVAERLRIADGKLAAELGRLRNLLQNERKSNLGAVETARAEWASLISSERRLQAAAVERFEGGLRHNQEELAGMEADLALLQTAVSDLSTRLADQQGNLESAVARALVDAERKLVERVEGRLRSERSARLFETAQLRVGSSRPSRLVVIMTPQRTGSTLLTDLLRAHPDGGFWPTAELFTALGAGGRRYPADLSPDAGRGDVIEVQHGVGGLVPSVGIERRDLAVPAVAIEKIHPMTVDFDSDALTGRIDRLETEGIEVTLVYQVRDPVESIRSFLAYQQRAEGWHADFASESVVGLYRSSYEMMGSLFSKRPGPVIEYATMRESTQALVELYLAVFGGRDDLLDLAAAALAGNTVESRKSTQKGPFVDADRRGVPSRADILLGWPTGAEAERSSMERLMVLYQELTARALPSSR
jgi:hypothetical protein